MKSHDPGSVLVVFPALNQGLAVRAPGKSVQPVDTEMTVVVDRPRLVQQLIYHGPERGTIITAPAGWGKTTAAQQWSAVAGDATGGGGAKLVVGSERASATWQQVRDALIASGTLAAVRPDPRAIAAGLAEVTRPTFIRLDDFHRAESQLAEDIVELIARTPHWVNMVMITRDAIPSALHSLVDHAEIQVMTARDLAFRPAEVVALWKKIHREEPRATDVETVLSRTRGQPAAVNESISDRSG